MKEKLKDYQELIVPAIFAFISVIFFYNDKFIIGSIVLLMFIINSYYLSIKEQSNDDKKKRLVSKLKLNINDSISNMVVPIALINENGDIIWANNKLTQDIWEKYCKGSISKWEMDSISCYIHEHELAHVDLAKYGLVDFYDLNEILSINGIQDKNHIVAGTTIKLWE